jgi:uncharacterized protein
LITLDTSGVYGLVNEAERQHGKLVKVMLDEPPPYVIAVPILAEIAYLIEVRLGEVVLNTFLDDLQHDRYTLDCAQDDIGRIRTLIQRYRDLPPGFADAAMIACAERHGGKVLTLDRRHLGVVEGEGTISLLTMMP